MNKLDKIPLIHYKDMFMQVPTVCCAMGMKLASGDNEKFTLGKKKLKMVNG